MIHIDSHSIEWLQEVRKTNFPQKDPTLIERVIRALTLLEELKLAGLDFIFKGGTCLVLILKEPKRFSVDIDITVNDENINFDEIFSKIVATGKFTKFEEDRRDYQKTKVPKQHFKFFYNSAIPKSFQKPPYILLDIVKHKSTYPKHKTTIIKSFFVKHHGDDIEVTTPTIESILGDKLTAFAPKTTGIRYNTEKELEIIKQLYDVSRLFDDFVELDEVYESFKNTAIKELEYRELTKMTEKEVLLDSIEASETIVFEGAIRDDEYKELDKGIKIFSNYVFDRTFHKEHAKVSAGKSAYLARLMLNNHKDIKRYKSTDDIKELIIENQKYQKLANLKKTNPEAYFYWYQISKLDVP